MQARNLVVSEAIQHAYSDSHALLDMRVNSWKSWVRHCFASYFRTTGGEQPMIHPNSLTPLRASGISSHGERIIFVSTRASYSKGFLGLGLVDVKSLFSHQQAPGPGLPGACWCEELINNGRSLFSQWSFCMTRTWTQDNRIPTRAL